MFAQDENISSLFKRLEGEDGKRPTFYGLVPEKPNLDNLAHMLVTFVTTAVKLVIQSCIIPYVMTRNLISIPMMQSRWRGKVEQGRRRTAVGKQMEMEVRKELWRKCAMPAAGSLHRGR